MTEKVETISTLWGQEIVIPKSDTSIINKVKKPKKIADMTTEKVIKSKRVPLADKIKAIETDVYKILGKYTNSTIVIDNYDDLINYIDKSISNGIVAVDTETNRTLDQIQCKLMGLCLYTPGMSQAYVPVNHCHWREEGKKIIYTGKLENQVTEEQIGVQLKRLVDNNVRCLFHNAAFDIGVLMSTCNVRLSCFWDSSIASSVIDETEEKGLKKQYKLHIDPSQDKYDIEHLFKGLDYEVFDPKLFSLYAATDSYMTFKLYEYQLEELSKPDNNDVFNLYKNIELPCIDAVVDMQQSGISVDIDYAGKMSAVYTNKLEAAQRDIDEELVKLKPQIDAWRMTPEANEDQIIYVPKTTKLNANKIVETYPFIDAKGKRYKIGKSKAYQLKDPIQTSSAVQLRILLYDVIKVPVVDITDPTGTGAEILTELAEIYHISICEKILAYREVETLLNSFINKIPELVKEKTGKVHAKFNQYGAKTGRFSSGEKDEDNKNKKTLNLQNIPSHDKLVRMIFKASPGYSICGGDFGAQEVRVLASLANDSGMINAYAEGKDLYAVIGSMAFKVDYKDCLEFPNGDGVVNPEGKARRSKAKTLLLGLNYSMGIKSLASSIGTTEAEAAEIKNNFYSGFDGVDRFTKASQDILIKQGFVTDVYGRRRHLPDATLPDFTVEPSKNSNSVNTFNPLLGSCAHINENTLRKIEMYKEKLSTARWKRDIDAIVQEAKKDNISIRNNRWFKSKAMRQCLNARIQGSSASITKRAMGIIHNDEEMKRLGFRLLITVHDELLGEAPTENAKRASERLAEIMIEAAKETCNNVVWKVDPYVVTAGWYEDEVIAKVKSDYDKMISKGSSAEEAYSSVCNSYNVLDKDAVRKVCNGTYEIGKDDIKHGVLELGV